MNLCGTEVVLKPIYINTLPDAGIISGSDYVCIGASVTMSEAISGGIWSVTNPNSSASGAVITGVVAGPDTINYSITNVCGTSISVKTITINPLPNAGIITGIDSVCIGAVTSLTSTISGGNWAMQNSKASISAGVITGVTGGLDTAIYIVTTICGTDTTTKSVSVLTLPATGTITGPDTVCVGATIVLDSSVTGGAWLRSNTKASVVNRVVTGVTQGRDTIFYSLTNYCGSDSVAKSFYVNTVLFPGIISGTSAICAGATTTLSESVSGGIWSATNGNSSVAAAVITGVVAGLDTIQYSVTNLCGTSVATKIFTVNPLPNAGLIIGLDSVCTGTSITLSETSSTGLWSISNGNATISGGVITGVTSGADTAFYTASTICGTDSARKHILILTLPSAGTLSGADTVCVGATIVIDSTIPSGTWVSEFGTASVFNGVVTGISPGSDIIFYTKSNYCGTDTARKAVYVHTIPYAGTISGNDTVCVGATITLTDTVAGGMWWQSGTEVGLSGGVVTGIASGTDTITYAKINSCGLGSATKTIVIDNIPDIGLIAGVTSVCAGDSIFLSDSIPGGLWSTSNASAYVEGNIVIGVSGGTDTITYSVNSRCGMAAGATIITINVFPQPIITGPTYACVGKPSTLAGYPVGGWWSITNTNAAITSTGVITGNNPGLDTVHYSLTNTCGTVDTAISILVYSAHDCDSINLVPNIPGQSINVLVYPNPNTGAFTVELPDNVSLSGTAIVITDLLGNVISTQRLAGNASRFVEYNLSNLAAATYFVKVEIEGQTFRAKMVVW